MQAGKGVQPIIEEFELSINTRFLNFSEIIGKVV